MSYFEDLKRQKLQRLVKRLTDGDLNPSQTRSMSRLVRAGLSPVVARKVAATLSREEVAEFLVRPVKFISSVDFLTERDISNLKSISEFDLRQARIYCFLNQKNGNVFERVSTLETNFGDCWKELKNLELNDSVRIISGRKSAYVYTTDGYISEEVCSSWLAEKSLGANTPIELGHQSLSDNQIAASHKCLRNKISVLTGLPGTGKTTTSKFIIDSINKSGLSFCLLASTGAAAKRLSQSTGCEATTCHMAIMKSLTNRKDGPLYKDFVLIDEASMLDQQVASVLFCMLPNHASVILIGDPHQLQSVADGEMLHNCINSKAIEVSSLNRIFRSSSVSMINRNAHSVSSGKMLEFDDSFTRINPSDLTRSKLLDLFNEGFQFITPSNNVCGRVNAAILEALDLKPLWRGERNPDTFYSGSRVVFNKNDYDIGVVNGDRGILVGYNGVALTVEVDGNTLQIPDTYAEHFMTHGYCSTIHKSQGQEYPKVCYILTGKDKWAHNRSMLYTAFTRAKSNCVIAASEDSILSSINNNTVGRRNSFLRQKIKSKHDFKKRNL